METIIMAECVNCGKRKGENCENCDDLPKEKKYKQTNIIDGDGDGDGDGDDDSDSDVEDDSDFVYHSDGYESIEDEAGRPMNKRERRLYAEQVHRSQGFDVDYFPGVFGMCLIVPLVNPGPTAKEIKRLTKYATRALGDYNHKKDTNWEFSKIIKANGQAACGLRYYITFEAKKKKKKNAGAEFTTKIFQAMVTTLCGELDLELCRKKPIKKKKQNKNKLDDSFDQGKAMVASAMSAVDRSKSEASRTSP